MREGEGEICLCYAKTGGVKGTRTHYLRKNLELLQRM